MASTDEFLPVLDDVGDLSAERIRRGQRRGAQHVDQVEFFAPQRRARAKKVTQPSGDLLIAGHCREGLIRE
jgi:hypothetical protein